MRFSRTQQIFAEFTGTAILVAAIVGSGVMGERLANGNAAVALLANSIATGAMLLALIPTFAPISGSHFNPLVTLASWSQREGPGKQALVRMAAQILGGLVGVAIANAMFDLPVFFASLHARVGLSQLLSEVVATFGLIVVVRLAAAPSAIAAYIVGAYWFTSSTSFANPAVTLARMLTDTFAGIRPADVPGFLAAQLVGCAAATLFCRFLTSKERKVHAV